ncbi:hypothetical protein AKJ29_07390 [Aliiroseovarius crassostreae]|uniref:Uncharacterized protein n=1 Tax=Aliiroseovarius crassostreae TaxID=154981 RepID=A0A0P7ITF9_9RHOB|nr:hypothetical protein [Aliiroseovarius crassostreae]KPN62100.1 hypothetical protein AKJ29_07390 [Aliiroseovarius crassostreae]
MNASGFGCRHASFGAFRDEITFILSKHRKLTIDHLSDCCVGVDALRDGVKVDAAISEVIQYLQ